MVNEKNITSDKSEQGNEQSVKYYYYTATILVKDKDNYVTDITYISGAISTLFEDFPIRATLKTIAERYGISIQNVIITFYKQITESNFKAYHYEQD